VAKVQHDSETLADGRQVFTACALIWHEFDGVKKVFLAKRAATKKFLPGAWELPGGHIEFGEDMREGLAREVREEFGMDIEIGEVVDVFTYLNDIKKSHSIEVVYFARFSTALENISIQPEDHSAFGWFSADEYKTKVAPTMGDDDPENQIIRKAFTKLADN
jgi:8-oxo-dGTP diphosphatase